MPAMNLRTQGKLLIVVAVLMMVGLAALAGPVAGKGTPEANEQTMTFDVAEDMSRFVFDQSVAHEDGMPKHGSPFITQGYIYPEGTLSGGNGVLPDGSPEFPDKVIGEWTCRGWFVGDGAHATTGPMVVTTQIYNFGDVPGAQTLVSDGYELADVGVVVERAITGGTGSYAGTEGVVNQTFLGFNASEGVNLTIEVVVSNS
jgi:hypothetical protein